MPILQFTPLSSFPSPSFWQQLTSLKLDTLKLDDSVRDIQGWLEEGRSVLDRESGEEVWISGHLMVEGQSFAELAGDTAQSNTIPLHGKFRNFNTIEEFRSPELKKQLFSETVQDLINTFSAPNHSSQIPTFNPFLLVCFADLKKYVYHYWFAFPALVQKPAWEIVVPDEDGETGITAQSGMREWEGDLKQEAQITAEAFLYRPATTGEPADTGSVAPVTEWWSFFKGVPEEERTLVFHDPTSSATLPGWTLRNVLYYLAHHLPPPTSESPSKTVTSLKVIALRAGSSKGGGTGGSKVFNVKLPSGGEAPASVNVESTVGKKGEERAIPAAVGWERNSQGKLASRVADLGSTMDPKHKDPEFGRLADQAVDLNLKLMRWRIIPSLNLEKIAGTRCLLLGAGTLGCYVARGLLGWGVRNITFVDSAKVSFSNPARQPLFEFEDSLAGGKPKAATAAEALKRICPNVNASGIAMSIPMPGHPVSSAVEASTRNTVAQLESLIKAHDVVFLLMDSRESRWLPTLLAAMENKIVINAALGFDSWLVMRHGAGITDVNSAAQTTGEGGKKRLGCYFCNDIVAPTDSLTDRTLDQMCTVTRPGIAPIAAASAVELMVSLIQHPEGINAPAEGANTAKDTPEPERRSPLGLVPHQLRGFLGQWKTMLIEGAAYDRCTGCSGKIVDAYRELGFDMLLRAFNEPDYLQSITGLDELYEEGEAALEAIDWDDGSDEGSL
ncbi:hypothetical protein QFC24_005429 [Naganishia onofrii]|uniref:Uncharacterized protein n=1 Tax=Naganishia onofrii TaxID=1851511 RepID=A0ACC2X8J9_9TREE|nr:hypothetical protein QFC24_005429 [Naganishia onofrii]